MRYATFLHLAREGWFLLVPLGLAGLGLALLLDSNWPWMLALALAGLLALSLRDRDRKVPPQPLGLVAPADGRIVHRRECHDPYLDRAAIRLSLRLDRRGVYYLRAPTEGTLMEIKTGRGQGRHPQSSWLRTDEGDDIVLVVSEGSLLGQRPCNAGFGQRLGQGRRCGMRRLARQIDLFIPATCRVDVALGEHVRAGSDVLATMVHNVPMAAAKEAV